MKTTRFTHRFVRLAIIALALAIGAGQAGAQQTATYEIVSTFDQTSGRPVHVIQTRTGQFYATTLIGVFAMAADGSHTMVYRFPPNSIGGFFGGPGGLSEGTDGNLYGTTNVFSVEVGSPGHIF